MATEATVDWHEVSAEAAARLARSGTTDSAAIEVRRLVEAASGCDPGEYHQILNSAVTLRQMAAFDRMLERRLTGEPLQYVIGSWAFRSLDLFVDRRVLIPRPETEVVAEHALHELDRVRRHTGRSATVVDLGTGSGAIALSFAVEREGVEVYATDASEEAIQVARANLAGLGRRAQAVRLRHGSWFDALPAELRGRVDLVVSNPPYVAAGDELEAAVRDWEPGGALIAGPTGLEAFVSICGQVRDWLVPHGAVVFEIGATQAASVSELVRGAGFREVEVAFDLAGRDRVVIGRL